MIDKKMDDKKIKQTTIRPLPHFRVPHFLVMLAGSGPQARQLAGIASKCDLPLVVKIGLSKFWFPGLHVEKCVKVIFQTTHDGDF